MRNFLVTGGLGFIGSHFVDSVLQTHSDVSVVILDSMRDESRALQSLNILSKKHRSNLEIRRGDITDGRNVQRIFEERNIDTVFHFAAMASNLEAIRDPLLARKINTLGSIFMYETALRYHVQTYYHQSTCEVYGDHLIGAHPFTTHSPLRAHSPYNRSKADADLYLTKTLGESPMRTIIGRPCNAYGYRAHPDALIPSLIRNAFEKKQSIITGDGKQQREWIHVSDLCCGIMSLVDTQDATGIFNIGTGEERSVNQIVQDVSDALHGLGIEISPPRYVQSRPFDDQRYLLDSSKTYDHVKWKPTIHFDEGIKITVREHVENKNDYESSREIRGEDHSIGRRR